MLALLLVSFAGFVLATYIRRCKTKKQPLVCPINGSCDMVTGSKYAQLFGIPVDFLGMLYYGCMTLAQMIVLAIPALHTREVSLVFLACTAFAVLFSLYLFSIQAFVIKHWCTWCLLSAVLSVTLFLLAFAALPAGVL